MGSRRVVMTGMGWVTPLGTGIEEVWARLLAGESGVSRIDRFDAATFPTTFAAQVRGYDFRRSWRERLFDDGNWGRLLGRDFGRRHGAMGDPAQLAREGPAPEIPGCHLAVTWSSVRGAAILRAMRDCAPDHADGAR